MNVLAEKQLKVFEPSICEVERQLREEEFNKLYYQLRNKDENGLLGSMSLEARKKLHWLILFIYTLKNRLGGFSYEIIHDGRMKTNRPIIYAITHVGKFDIEVTSEAIKEHCYLLSGDYEHIQGTIDAPFLLLNGVIYFNEKIKADRSAVTNKMIAHLKAGGNIMYFPEGTWNLSPNLPMLPCYWGIVEIAQKSNSIIIPVAVEQYQKHFKINIGNNFDMKHFGNNNKEKAKAISKLRDVMSTLKYEIWESEPRLKRKTLCGNEWEKYVEERFKEWPYFNQTYINELIFKPKNVVTPTEAFSYLNKLIPCKENAFLFRKK
ncbi:MAG: hypothetical protein E7284_10905 [Lachnospiraceae bacterium]|nr:hypothetical protein [Lachnospiraceae bacterium]